MMGGGGSQGGGAGLGLSAALAVLRVGGGQFVSGSQRRG